MVEQSQVKKDLFICVGATQIILAFFCLYIRAYFIYLLISQTKWRIVQVKYLSLDIFKKNISLMKMNRIILMLHTCIILSSSFVIYYFHIRHSRSFSFVFGCRKRIPLLLMKVSLFQLYLKSLMSQTQKVVFCDVLFHTNEDLGPHFIWSDRLHCQTAVL